MMFRTVTLLGVITTMTTIQDVNPFTLPPSSPFVLRGRHLVVHDDNDWKCPRYLSFPTSSSRSCRSSLLGRNRPYRRRTSILVSTSSETRKMVPSEDDDGDNPILPSTMGGLLSSSRSPLPGSLPTDPVSKFRKLKDIMWIREAVEDVTAAEFACSVEGSSEGEKDASLRRKRKRAVDYEKMLSNLDRRLTDMIPPILGEVNGDVNGSNDDDSWELDETKGMGRYAYSSTEREDLLKKVLKTREGLLEIIKSHSEEEAETENESEGGGGGVGGFGFELPEIPEIRVGIPKEDDSGVTTTGPRLYVRDDGTVDWEGALQDREALKKFGGAVWARINGQTPDDLPDDEDSTKAPLLGGGSGGGGSHGEEKRAVTAKIEETPSIQQAREELNRLQQDLQRATKAHKKLLSSGILEGQAVANVRLASLDPGLRTKIRLSGEALHTLEQQVSYQNLVYELERIYTYLATELGNPSAKGYVPLQDRLNVAEYGLLEGQVETRSRELIEKGTLDADVLVVITEQMTDFKRRLGIDYYVTGLTYDKEAIQAWLADILGKTKGGLRFYVKGCQLFWDDIVYCSTLIARAAQGYTLKPREVRTIRRTFKDIITFIPVVIILIIPLSPVGHVLVFGAIQRFFPGFFPSCFTEQRQNLLQLYESTEYSEITINESISERFTRFLEAGLYLAASNSKEFYRSLIGQTTDDSKSESSNDKRS